MGPSGRIQGEQRIGLSMVGAGVVMVIVRDDDFPASDQVRIAENVGVHSALPLESLPLPIIRQDEACIGAVVIQNPDQAYLEAVVVTEWQPSSCC